MIESRRCRCVLSFVSLMIVVIVSVFTTASAGAEDLDALGRPGQALPNNTVSVDPAVIGRQIRAAIALGEQARTRLAGPGTDDLPGTHQLLDTMYRQVRRALGNLNDRKAIAKFPDPLLDMEINKVTVAWNTIRRPVDGYFNSPAKDEWKAGATQDLQVTMATLRQVEAMFP